MSRRRAGALLGGVLLLAVVAVVAAQLVLPGIAEDRVRTQLAPAGTVERVAVRARPAVELLWGDVDAIDVRMRTLDLERLPRGEAGLDRLAGVRAGTITAGRVRSGELRARDVRVDLREGALRLRGDVALDGLLRSLGRLPGVDPELRADEDALTLEVRGGGLGGVGARAVAEDGRVVLQPQARAGPFSFGGGFGERTLVEDPDVAFTRVGGRRTSDGVALDVRGRLRAARR